MIQLCDKLFTEQSVENKSQKYASRRRVRHFDDALVFCADQMAEKCAAGAARSRLA
jgi:hypothetical protein